MDKIIVTKDMIRKNGERTIEDRFGNVIHVKQRIPYEQKELMAIELASYTQVTDEENGAMYASYQFNIISRMLLCKYYTNISIDGMDSNEARYMLMDYLETNDMLSQILAYTQDDYSDVLQIFEKVSDALQEAFDGSHSLQKRLLKMIGSTLTDEDVTETLAKSEEVNSVMLDLIDAYKEKSAKKTMRTNGGAVINFSKKKK